ncbi:arginine decarboxylase, partial [Clostridioides difficile]
SIQVELGDLYNILALVSIGTNKSDIDRLVKALSIIEKTYRKETKLNEFNMIQINPTIELNPREAFYASKESIEIRSCIGRICGESIMAYPPGIPIVTPGELITKEIMEYIIFLKKSNAYLTDMQDKNLDTILVIK